MRPATVVPKNQTAPPVSPALPFYKNHLPLTPLNATLPQLLIPNDFNSCISNTYKKRRGESPSPPLQVCQFATTRSPRLRDFPDAHELPQPLSLHGPTANSLDTPGEGSTLSTDCPSPMFDPFLSLRPVTSHKLPVTSPTPISFTIKFSAQTHPYLPSNHILMHSFAPPNALSPIVSYCSALLPQNTRGGVGGFPLLTTHYSLPTSSILKPLPSMAHRYTCTRKKGPAAREPRYSPCAAC